MNDTIKRGLHPDLERSRSGQSAFRRDVEGAALGDVRSLVVMHSADVSGPSRSLENELEWLAGRGEMDVLVPGRGRLHAEFGRFALVRYLEYSTPAVPTNPVGVPTAVHRVRREVRRFRNEIRRIQPGVLVATSPLLFASLLAARAEGVPAILYAGEILDAPRVPTLPRQLAGMGLLRLTARLATAVVACSDRVGRQYTDRGAANVTTINPPIGWRYARGESNRFRDRLGISADAPLIVSVGAITHGRAQDVLIRALPHIRSVVPDAHLAIVGEPHQREVDREYARELARMASEVAPGAVTFPGFEERVEDAYAAASVVANPSRYEGFGRVAFEAALANRPVVSTSAGAIPEVLRDETDALLVPPDSPEEVAEAVVRVLEDRELGSRLALSGGTRARAEMSPAGSLAAFQATISESLELAAA